MSLRNTVFWGIVLAIVAIVVLEALFDVAVDAVVTQHHAAFHRRVDQAIASFERRITDGEARHDSVMRAFDPDGREIYARLATPASEGAGPWPPSEGASNWFTTYRDRHDGVRFEVAVERRWFERVLMSSIALDLLDLPLFIAIAFGAAALVSNRVQRPIAALNTKVDAFTAGGRAATAPVAGGSDELTRLARSFDAMMHWVERSLEREGTFTRYASHELRTPLAALKIQVARARAGTADVASVLPAMERNVKRLEIVLQALQAIAQAGDRDSAPTPLGEVISDLLAALPVEARSRINTDTIPSNVLVSDAQLVRQALHNLLDNSVAYASGPTTLSHHVQGASLTLRVRDVGRGVGEEDLPRLTEPFYRPAGAEGTGLGLGLSLVDVIARALEGELDLRNTHVGFEATLRLPVVVAS